MSHLRESAPEILQVQCSESSDLTIPQIRVLTAKGYTPDHPPPSRSTLGTSNYKAEVSPQIAASRVAMLSKYAFVAPADNPTPEMANTTSRSPLCSQVGLGRLSRYLISPVSSGYYVIFRMDI